MANNHPPPLPATRTAEPAPRQTRTPWIIGGTVLLAAIGALVQVRQERRDAEWRVEQKRLVAERTAAAAPEIEEFKRLVAQSALPVRVVQVEVDGRAPDVLLVGIFDQGWGEQWAVAKKRTSQDLARLWAKVHGRRAESDCEVHVMVYAPMRDEWHLAATATLQRVQLVEN
jgi:hypothetical protein